MAAPRDRLDRHILIFLEDEATVPGHDRDAIHNDFLGAIEMTAHLGPAAQRAAVGGRFGLHRRVLDRLLVEAIETAAANARRRKAAA